MIFTRKIIKIDSSFYVGLDYPIIRHYNLSEGDKVDVEADEDKIIIRKISEKND